MRREIVDVRGGWRVAYDGARLTLGRVECAVSRIVPVKGGGVRIECSRNAGGPCDHDPRLGRYTDHAGRERCAGCGEIAPVAAGDGERCPECGKAGRT